MKAGDSFECPSCGRDSFIKKESVMDGWTKVGEIFACAACSAKIADTAGGADAKADDNTVVDKGKSNALAAFLGTEKDSGPRITASDDEKRFCRDCAHYIAHPFMNWCSKFDKSVEPMDDCPDFEHKSLAPGVGE